MKILILAIMLTLLSLNLGYADDKNYCHDEEANREWEELIETYPNDMNVHALHALRLVSYFKVKK